MAEIKWNGDLIEKLARDAATGALALCGADLLSKSVMEAPIDTGDLRGNGSVSDVNERGDELVVTVGYDLPYAIVQHEHTEFRHPKGGKAKYLEDPYKANVHKYKEFIAKWMNKSLGGK